MSQDGQLRQARSIAVDVQQLAAGRTVVRLNGDVIGNAAIVLQQTLIDQLSQSPTQLIVDLSAVRRIDTSGVDALASAAAVAGESDHAFCLIDGEAGHLHAALAAAQLIELFEVFSSVGQAIEESV